MTEQGERVIVPVRLMVRVHIREVSPFDVAEIQQLIKECLSAWPDAEVETAMLPMLPRR